MHKATTIPIQVSMSEKRMYFILKRSADLLLALIVCAVILSWLVPLMAILIPLSTGGSPFFLQPRRGQGGRSFHCIKFRTMVPNAQANFLPAAENDPRITKLGRWLRDLNIDELPQFINVLMGNMSVIGPRPHMHSDCERFSVTIPRYNSRHLVRPGITGLAQVKGYHGPAMDEEAIYRRYCWDIWYVRNCTAVLDFRILTGTVFQLFSNRSRRRRLMKPSPSLQYPQKVKSLYSEILP